MLGRIIMRSALLWPILLGALLTLQKGATAAIMVDRTDKYNFKQLGALGDNASDDGPALRAAVASLTKAGGGTLYVPEGSYVLVPQTAVSFYMATLTSDTAIECEPGGKSVFKMGGTQTLTGQGAGFFYISGASNVAIRHCVFDYNGHRWKAGEPLQFYYAINVDAASSSVVIENNTFLNNPGTNTVVVGGSGSDHVVRGNHFVNGGKDITGGNPYVVDHTAVYVAARGAQVEDNVIEWDAALGDATGARSGIEIHASGASVRKNRITRSTLGIRVEVDTNGAQVTDVDVLNNQCTACITGIWLSAASGVTTQGDFRKLRIEGNHLTVQTSPALPGNPAQGIGMAHDRATGQTRAVLHNSSVSHNVIESASLTTPGNMGLILSSLREVQIIGNYFVNGTRAKIQGSSEGISSLLIAQNVFTNARNAASPSGLLWFDFSPLGKPTVYPRAQNIVVEHNAFSRDPNSRAAPNVRAFQLDWDTVHSKVEELRFNKNSVANIKQKTGTAAGTVVIHP
jgi:Pectate lyase superfamily protein